MAEDAEKQASPSAPHYHGHRERLRERFREAGAEALSDYELLELVLFRALPRRDVKPLAKELIATFGSFAEVMSAPPARLAEIKGMGDGRNHRTQDRARRGEPAGARRGEEAPGAVVVVEGASTIAAPPWPSPRKSSFACCFSTSAIS